MKLPWYLLAIDLETTGSDPEKSAICQIGAVLVSPALEEMAWCDTLVKPLAECVFEQGAMDCHKIPKLTMETDGKYLHEALETLERTLMTSGLVNFRDGQYRNVVLASWANYFDIPFLRRQYEKIGRPFPFNYKSIDFKSIAIWEMAKRDVVIKEGLSAYASTLGLTFDGTPHNALADIKSACRVLRKLGGLI